MAGLIDFLKKNASENSQGALGGLGVASDLSALAKSDNKLKAIYVTLKNLIVGVPLFQAAIVAAFTAMNKGIKSLLLDTGSLDAALRKLSQIRGLEKSIAPFVGGLKEAKQRVAELLVMTKSSNFKFEQFGTAAQTLMVFTRGLYSSSTALNTVADAAADTHNNLTDVASAVGDFYSAMRNGQPIDSAADSLRQMGLITQQDASYLDKLSASGAGATRMANTLNEALARHHGGQARSLRSNNPEDVAARSGKAVTAAQEAFGSPFAEKDVSNTKNYIAALQAITPVIASVARFFAILTTQFNTTYSWFVKIAAQSPMLSGALGGLAKGLGMIVTVSAAIAGTMLLGWIGKATALTMGYTGAAKSFYLAGMMVGKAEALMSAMGLSWIMTGRTATAVTTGLSVALRVLAGATVLVEVVSGFMAIVAVISAVVAAASGLLNVFQGIGHALGIYTGQSKQAEKATREMAAAFDEANKKIKEQIAAITDLASRHAALGAALDAVQAAQDKLNDTQNEAPGKGEGPSVKHAKVAKAKEELDKARETLDTIGKTPGGTLGSEANTALIEERLEEERMLRDESFAARMETASPAGRISIMGEQLADVSGKRQQGALGLVARKEIAEATSGGEQVAADKQAQLIKLQGDLAEKDAAIQRRKDKLDKEGTPGMFTSPRHTYHHDAEQSALEAAQKERDEFAKKIGVTQLQLGHARGSDLQFATQDKYKGTAAYDEARAQQIREYMQSNIGGKGATAAEKAGHLAASGGVRGTQQDINQLKAQAAQKKNIEARVPELAAKEQQLTADKKVAEREYQLAELRLGAESQIAVLHGTGIEKARQVYDITMQRLNDEIAVQTKLGAEADDQEIQRLENEKKVTAEIQKQAEMEAANAETDLEAEENISNLKYRGVLRANVEYAMKDQQMEEEAQRLEQSDNADDPRKARDIRAKQSQLAFDHETEQIQQRIEEGQIEAAEKVGDLTDVGNQRAKEEYEIKRKQNIDEANILQDAGEFEKARMKFAEQAAADEEERQRTRQENVGKLGMTREIREQEARLSGNSGDLQKMKDMDAYAENLEKARGIATAGGGKTAEQNAQDIAQRMTANSIRLQGMGDVSNFTGKVHADELARIGGGGGIEQARPGSPASIQKRIADMTAQSLIYLKQISDSKALID